jgi:hypothetical protein
MKANVRQLRQVLKDLAHIDLEGECCWCPDGPCAVHDALCAEIRRLLEMGPVETRAVEAPVDQRWPVRPVPAQVQETLDL